ncbi:MaoC family dehydratase [Chloroflexota bacterium]
MSIFEELVPAGKKFVSQGRTIVEADISLLSSLTWINSRLHTDREYMKRTQFGERILPGPCVLACVIGLAGGRGVLEMLNSDKLRAVALLGFEEVRFRTAVKAGDTITVHTEIIGVRPTSKNPKRGVVQIRDVAFNQDEQEVMSATRNVMAELTA